MKAGTLIVVAWLPLALPAAWAGSAAGQEVRGTAEGAVRYYDQDGVTYREVREVRKRPVVETRYEPRERTVYREQVRTETQTSQRAFYMPVTEYQLQPRWHNVLNPFVQPHVAYHYVPVTRWELRTEEVRRPVVTRSIIPESEVVNVPVQSRRMVDEEVITRTAVSTTPGRTSAGGDLNLAERPIGGVKRLDNDPPRHGDGWRHAGDTRRY